jgi:histidinol-phosphate phosphatase family protein
MVSEDFVRSVHNLFIHEYGFDAFYYCPHHPDDHCSCRKPEPGMLVDAGRDHHIDLRRSFVIGDKESDMLLAAAVGARGILVRTGQTRTSAYAGYVVDDLEGAVAAVLSADRGEILA